MAQPYFIQEQRFDPQARAEASQALQGLPEAHLVQVCATQKKESEDATRELRRKMDEWWTLYNNQVDFTGKEDWQAQVWVPKPFAAVEQATAILQRALVDNPDFWSIGAQNPNDTRAQGLADNLWKPLLTRILADAHFTDKYTAGAIKTGFITGVTGYLKPRLQVSTVPTLSGVQMDPQRGPVPQFTKKSKTFITIDWVDPRNVYRDPDSRPMENFSGSYLWHSEWKPRTFLRAMQQMGWDADKIEQIVSSGSGTGTRGDSTGTETDRANIERRTYSQSLSKFRQTHLVNEGWLDIPDENGDIVFPDALMVDIGDKVVYLNDNPLWAVDLGTGRRKWPFLAGAPIIHPSRFEGRGILEQDADLSWLYSNVFMLWADGLNWLVNGTTEVHQDALVDWEDLDHYPGKLWVKKVATPALTPAQVGKMDTRDVLAAMEFIDQVRQNVNFVTDFAIGLPGTRSNVTKGEVQIKTAQSLGVFDGIAQNCEMVALETIQLVREMAVQFLMVDPTDPSIASIIGNRNVYTMAQASLPERVEMVQGDFDVKFTGLSQALQRDSSLQKLVQFGAMAAQPPYLPMLMQSQPQVFMEILIAARNMMGLGDKIEIDPQVPPPPPPPTPPPPKVSVALKGDLDPVTSHALAEGQPPPAANGGPPGAPPGPPGPGGLDPRVMNALAKLGPPQNGNVSVPEAAGLPNPGP